MDGALKRSRWRYGGAVQPGNITDGSGAADGVSRQTRGRAFKIKGLASADFMVSEGHALLLEINPRPGATLDIFDAGATPLLRLHLDAAIEGRLPRGRPQIR